MVAPTLLVCSRLGVMLCYCCPSPAPAASQCLCVNRNYLTSYVTSVDRILTKKNKYWGLVWSGTTNKGIVSSILTYVLGAGEGME